MTFEPLNLEYLKLNDVVLNHNLDEDTLIQLTLDSGAGQLNNTGALMVDTGEFTGRSPKDRFIVKDDITANAVNWNSINLPFDADKFDALQAKMIDYLNSKDELYVRDAIACAAQDYQLKVRVINELPWQNLFVRNMFIEPTGDQQLTFMPDWHVIAAPSFKADPAVDGTRQHNFAIINFEKQTILIGGTAYTGEIKKGIFSVLNFILPKKEGVLSMHCSANMGDDGDTAIFFGLSGTGKTTLSADPNRNLIGDDEHGWSNNGVFNFEGGCYAKTINLSKEGEPEIYGAIRKGALVENMRFKPGTKELDFENSEVTQNIRVSYPIEYINNARIPSTGGIPENIFMLTYDAFGVLPPISRLNEGQAMYQFISGFTSKVAGTEAGVTEPQGTFSACYGAPFMPLHPMEYAAMLGEKMREHKTNVWLVNTGLVAGPYGVGHRIKLNYTRTLIKAALDGSLAKQPMEKMPVFGFEFPKQCDGVPSEILNPRSQWEDKAAYDEKLEYLANAFERNFEQFKDRVSEEVLKAAPQVKQNA